MKIFYSILGLLVGIRNETYDKFINEEYVNGTSVVLSCINCPYIVLAFLFNSYTNSHYQGDFFENVHTKFKCVDSFLKNEFIDRVSVLNLFNKAQKHYMTLSRFVHMVKLKYAKNGNEEDMYLNTLCENKTKYCCILHANRKYYFTVFDLKGIINTTLSNNEYGFIEPLTLKNPYNNIPFTQANLYTIYFFFKFNYYNIPTLFHLYFTMNFDLSAFANNCEYYIKKQNTLNRIKGLNPTKKRKEIESMFYYFNDHQIQQNRFEYIHKDFPNELLFTIMEPYLKLYLLAKNSSLVKEKNRYRDEFFYKMEDFVSFNPKFGRKYIHKNGFTNTRTIKYEDKHPSLIQYSRSQFHTSHIEHIPFIDYSNNTANNNNYFQMERQRPVPSRFIQDRLIDTTEVDSQSGIISTTIDSPSGLLSTILSTANQDDTNRDMLRLFLTHNQGYNSNPDSTQVIDDDTFLLQLDISSNDIDQSTPPIPPPTPRATRRTTNYPPIPPPTPRATRRTSQEHILSDRVDIFDSDSISDTSVDFDSQELIRNDSIDDIVMEIDELQSDSDSILSDSDSILSDNSE